MAHVSAPEDLALHGVRVLGYATPSRIAERYGLDAGATRESLLDFEARGWVRRFSFAETSGWSLTEAGRTENERRLNAELDQARARHAATSAHAAFLPLNRRLGAACTDWQVRPAPADPIALNDHTDWRWDERVLRALASLDTAFRDLCDDLASSLARFAAYPGLFSTALRQAQQGQRDWVDAPDRDSCHLVWIQFHEDLLATLGIPRGTGT